MLDLNEIILVAQAILDRLGNKAAQWTVVDAVPTEVTESGPGSSLEPPRTVLVTAANTADASSTISAYFVLSIPAQQAVMQLASSLQDEVIEQVRVAVPECPGHAHPLTPRLVDDRAVWICPDGQ